MATSKEPAQRRDPEKEGRIFPTPIHRTQAAVQKHQKRIDDLTTSLPITTDETESNYHPAKIPPTREGFTSTKSGYSHPYYVQDPGTSFAYAPPADQYHDQKLNRILHMIEQNQVGYETPSSQDMMLYIFTGVFFLFTLDTFVNLGRRMK